MEILFEKYKNIDNSLKNVFWINDENKKLNTFLTINKEISE
nr:hypothetical protein [Mycoplasmopsis bovis]